MTEPTSDPPAPAPAPVESPTDDALELVAESPAPAASLIPAEAPARRPIDERPLLTERRPERLGRVAVRAVASALIVALGGSFVAGVAVFFEKAGSYRWRGSMWRDLGEALMVVAALAIATR